MKEKEEILKIKAVLLYILQHSEKDRHDVYSIVKTAYYAQQIHFVKWALPLYKDKIAALQFGPVPSTIYDILKISRGDTRALRYCDDALMVVSGAVGFENEAFYAKEDVDMDIFSQANVDCLNEAIAKVASMNFDEIVADTHGEEWNRAWKCTSHYMNDINIAKEGGADDSILDYLREALEIDELLG